MMFHFGRCGSSVLADCLSQSEQIFWHGEIFSESEFVVDNFNDFPISEKRKGGTFTLDEFVEYLDFCMALVSDKRKNTKIYGFELKCYHFEYGNFLFSLSDLLKKLQSLYKIKFVYLERSNALRRIVSSNLAKQTNEWHIEEAIEHKKTNQLKVVEEDFFDPDLQLSGNVQYVLSKALEKNTDYKTVFEAFNALQLNFESDVDNSNLAAFNKMLSFMDIKSFIPNVNYWKTNPKPLKEIIPNYSDVKSELFNKLLE